jgi:uncharacterized protein
MTIPKSKKNKIISPVFLVNKLDRYVGISTATGDFYSLSQEAYHALKEWDKELSRHGTYSPAIATKLATSQGIPKEIVELFPLPHNEKLAEDDKTATSCITDLTLNITSECNLRCVYCWNDHGRYSNSKFQKEDKSRREKSSKNGRMPPDVARKAVDRLIEIGGDDKNLVVDFYGGEPLMNLETLMTTVDYCRKKQTRSNINFHFLLATNGTLLTPSVAKELLDKGVQIAVSIDGPREIHDHNRPFLTKHGSYDTITSNIRNMPRDIMKRIVGRTTVTPFFPDMVVLYNSLKDLGFERIEIFESEDACHKITPGRESGFFATDKEFKVLCKEYEKLALLYIEEILRGFLDYKKTFFNRFFKLMQRLYYHHEVAGGCPAAKGQIAVMADGGIYPCTAFLGIKEFEFGNVKHGIDMTKYNNFIESANRRFDYCRDCPLFSLCRTTGSCLNMNYYFNGDPAISYNKSCHLFCEKLGLAVACLDFLSEKIPEKLEDLFGFDPVGRRGNKLY